MDAYLGLGEKALRVVRDVYTQRWIIPFPTPVDYVTNVTEQAIIRLTFFNVIHHIRVAKLYMGRFDSTTIGVENLDAASVENPIDKYGFIITYNDTRYSYVMSMHHANTDIPIDDTNPLKLEQLYYSHPFNPLTRPWYLLGQSISDIAFTSPYIDATGISYTLTLVGPLKNPNGSLYGVLAIDYFFQELSEYLQNFDTTGSQYDVHIMILERNGGMIATSHGNEITYIDGAPQRLLPQDVNDTILREAYWRSRPSLNSHESIMLRYSSAGTLRW